jgi:hypothetical protein
MDVLLLLLLLPLLGSSSVSICPSSHVLRAATVSQGVSVMIQASL